MNQKIAYQTSHTPSYASLQLTLQPNQTAVVEAGAMAAMDTCIKMKSKMKGGLMKSVGRMLAGESLFLSEFTAIDRPGDLYLSPGVPGDIQHYYLNGNALLVQSSGFVASGTGVEIDTKFQGFKGFFSGESLFLIRATGQGDLWFSSYGAILEVPVDGDYLVDTGYVVAFEDTLNYSAEMLGGLSLRGLKTGIFGGEGLVCRFRGRGRLWIQSRNLFPLLNFLNPFRPVKS
ncbi:MAG: TIGR00266 family protein [Oscillatoriales cyanobacterium RM2_1_1]|nr:TIGR00266 family protein [Oscillatoriales cyanobacterium SM2_3_0]NJO44919.1 TIGR00266 family protein [Oscillatoriales cyanobacterium RM2_1_1]